MIVLVSVLVNEIKANRYWYWYKTIVPTLVGSVQVCVNIKTNLNVLERKFVINSSIV